MATLIAFDTHSYVKKLVAAGFTEPQAEVQAEALIELVYEGLASKQDLKEFEVRVDARFDRMEARNEELKALDRIDGISDALETRIREAELRISVRMGIMLAAGMTITAALVKFL